MCSFLSGGYRCCLAILVFVFLLVSFPSSLTSLQPSWLFLSPHDVVKPLKFVLEQWVPHYSAFISVWYRSKIDWGFGGTVRIPPTPATSKLGQVRSPKVAQVSWDASSISGKDGSGSQTNRGFFPGSTFNVRPRMMLVFVLNGKTMQDVMYRSESMYA